MNVINIGKTNFINNVISKLCINHIHIDNLVHADTTQLKPALAINRSVRNNTGKIQIIINPCTLFLIY